MASMRPEGDERSHENIRGPKPSPVEWLIIFWVAGMVRQVWPIRAAGRASGDRCRLSGLRGGLQETDRQVSRVGAAGGASGDKCRLSGLRGGASGGRCRLSGLREGLQENKLSSGAY